MTRISVQCPVCRALLDAESPVSEITGGPQPGDFTICCYCAHVCVFTNAMQLRSVTATDVAQLSDTDCQRVEAMRQQVLYNLAVAQAEHAPWN